MTARRVQTLECTGPLTLVDLHGSANDADGDEVTFTWREGNTFRAAARI